MINSITILPFTEPMCKDAFFYFEKISAPVISSECPPVLLWELPLFCLYHKSEEISISHITKTLQDKKKKEKLSPRSTRQVVQEVSKTLRITRKVFLRNLCLEGIEILRSTLQRTLKKEGLKGYRPRKTPLLTARHIKAWLYFARKYIDKETSFWSSVLWSDKTKTELFGHRDVSFVWRIKWQNV